MDKSLIPMLPSSEAKKAYELLPWKLFARRITHNPYVKAYLNKRDGGICSYCQQPTGDSPLIHHISYDHCCTYGIEIGIPKATEKRPNRIRKTPDCESCHLDNSDRFETCMGKLRLVHSICNKLIEHDANDLRTDHDQSNNS
ncbi:hypothetical protein [Flaviaesturariibacter amylovorans]|uniref:HNH endonuclease n=1 Tax=Flaviaesturariibacter amylovorans TaxID=1084520 RepID=A0ABP8GLA9_9BACT